MAHAISHYALAAIFNIHCCTHSYWQKVPQYLPIVVVAIGHTTNADDDDVDDNDNQTFIYVLQFVEEKEMWENRNCNIYT